MSNEKQAEAKPKIEDLPEDPKELKDDEADRVKGGIGMLLPAVQKVREAASRGT